MALLYLGALMPSKLVTRLGIFYRQLVQSTQTWQKPTTKPDQAGVWLGWAMASLPACPVSQLSSLIQQKSSHSKKKKKGKKRKKRVLLNNTQIPAQPELLLSTVQPFLPMLSAERCPEQPGGFSAGGRGPGQRWRWRAATCRGDADGQGWQTEGTAAESSGAAAADLGRQRASRTDKAAGALQGCGCGRPSTRRSQLQAPSLHEPGLGPLREAPSTRRRWGKCFSNLPQEQAISRS